MPWFCGSSKKRRNKSKVGNITHSIDDSVLTNGRPSFTVALQDFDASVCDELTAQRGQVLEALYTDREWIYVRNIDGKCGYVPETFCYPLDAANESAFQKNVDQSSQQRPRPKSLHLDIVPLNVGSQSSVSVSQHIARCSQEQVDGPQPRTSTPVLRRASLATPESTLSHHSSSSNPRLPESRRPKPHRMQPNSRQYLVGEVDGAHAQTPASNLTLALNTETIDTPIVHHPISAPVTPALLTTPEGTLSHSSTSPNPAKPRRRSSSNEGQLRNGIVDSEHTVFQYPTRPKVIGRSVSVNEESQATGGEVRPDVQPVKRSKSYQEAVLTTEERLRHISDGAQDIRRLSSADSPGCTRENCDCSRSRPNARRNNLSKQKAVSDSTDDVFLSDTGNKKRFGIFRCLQDYKPKFKGELGLKQNELVIVLDYGRGEWAWSVTTQQVEGLIPKKLLVRYDPSRGVGGDSRRKPSDASTQTELVVTGAVRQVSNASSASGGPSISNGTPSLDSSSSTPPQDRGASKTIVASASVQTDSSSEWFMFSDSLERSLRSRNCSTPVTNRQHPVSAPVTPAALSNKQIRHLNGHTDRQTSHSTRAINESHRGKPVLRAARDYNPPHNTANCLTLKKGDVLTPQSHMHFPKGWMWVWHSEQKNFGYVPNSSVMYTYPLTRNTRRRTDTVEDAV